MIECVDDGYVIWKIDADNKYYDFKIIHQNRCDLDHYQLSNSLDRFLGVNGLTVLLSFLSLGEIKINLGGSSSIKVKNMDEFVDFVRRLQTPLYEEARPKFEDQSVLAAHSDSNEVYPYLLDSLDRIIKKY